MKLFVLLVSSLCIILNSNAQISNVQTVFNLPTVLNESSGIIHFNNAIYSHNDSGNSNQIFELNPVNGQITRTITITNATNIDWEDMTQDINYIYIGDIGNNSGNRTNLKIYKISKSDILSANTVTASQINYSYADQTSFVSNPNNTIWDAETLISISTNTLLVITKNWVNGQSKVYAIPKTPGTYNINPSATPLNNSGLITGGTFNPNTQKIYLTGYTNLLQPFVWLCENFSGTDIFSGTNTQTFLTTLGIEQVEGITFLGNNNYFLSSESFQISTISDTAKLISFTTNDAVLNLLNTSSTPTIRLYPNPVKTTLHIQVDNLEYVEIYDTKGAKIYNVVLNKISFENVQSGVYTVKIFVKQGPKLYRKILKL